MKVAILLHHCALLASAAHLLSLSALWRCQSYCFLLAFQASYDTLKDHHGVALSKTKVQHFSPVAQPTHPVAANLQGQVAE